MRSFKIQSKYEVGGDLCYTNKFKNWISSRGQQALKNNNLINFYELKKLLKKNNLILDKGFLIKNKKGDSIHLKYTEWHHFYIKNYHWHHSESEGASRLYFYNKQSIYNTINKLKK